MVHRQRFRRERMRGRDVQFREAAILQRSTQIGGSSQLAEAPLDRDLPTDGGAYEHLVAGLGDGLACR
jgi:hypothetical protein